MYIYIYVYTYIRAKLLEYFSRGNKSIINKYKHTYTFNFLAQHKYQYICI